MTFTELELAYLAGQPLGRLATVQPDVRGVANALSGPGIEGGAVIRIHPRRILSFNIDPAAAPRDV